MLKYLFRNFGALFYLAVFITIVMGAGAQKPNCAKPACSGNPCKNILNNDCSSPCFCTQLSLGLASSCHFCSTENCPCSNLLVFGAPTQSCCKGLKCLNSQSFIASGLGTCRK